mgnify:CR=1 FL=1
MRFRNLLLIGSSHIAKESIKEIEAEWLSFHPEILAIELDQGRMYALLHPEKSRLRLKDIRYIGVKGYIFAKIGAYIEEKLGKSVGVIPGADMRSAILLARKRNVPIALIDQEIAMTLKRFGKVLTWREKFRFAYDLIASIFGKRVSIDLRKVPDKDMIDSLLLQVKRRYPTVYKVLIVERNQFMANRLYSLMASNPDIPIMAVVGAGHQEAIIDILKVRFNNAKLA